MADETRQEWGTPRAVFEALHREYGFTVDVCASALNYKLPAHLTKEDNALSCLWTGERTYCNCPYISIDPWLAKWNEPELAYFLLPARTFNDWWLKYHPWAKRTEYFIGRMKFEPPPGVKVSSVDFPIVGLVFGDIVPGVVYRDAKTGERIDPMENIKF